MASSARISIERMNEYLERCERECNYKVFPLISEFCSKMISKTRRNRKDMYPEIAMGCAMFLGMNTYEDERLSEEDILSIKGILSILENILNEKRRRNIIFDKLALFKEMLCKNKAGMEYYKQDGEELIHERVFSSYKVLYLIINLINDNYNELISRGFSLHNVYYPFWKVMQGEKGKKDKLSEEDKVNMFIGIINGELKFSPVYETHAVGYRIVKREEKEVLIKEVNSSYDNELIMSEANLKTYELELK